MSKHTPGPWVADIVTVYGGEFADILAKKGRERPIAEISVNSKDPFTEEDRANAALIAAAPDLLAAVRHALAYMESRGTFDTKEVAAPLRAALKKAGGQ